MLRHLLKLDGEKVDRKHLTTLMKKMEIGALHRQPNTSKRYPRHRIYPYLLRNLTIDRPNQVWAMDITYLPMARGLVYLTAVLGTVTVARSSPEGFLILRGGLQTVDEAIAGYGTPEIFNTDQGGSLPALPSPKN